MKQLSHLISVLEEKTPMMQIESKQVSAAKVGWHIQHSLMVVNNIINALKSSDETAYKWSFNLKRVLVFSLGKIPRGKGKAPKSVIPDLDLSATLLLEGIEKAKLNILVLNDLHKNKHFKHPYFGALNLKPTIKFLNMHTKHHLLIIEDILKNKG